VSGLQGYRMLSLEIRLFRHSTLDLSFFGEEVALASDGI
jgi:hypothetical protein